MMETYSPCSMLRSISLSTSLTEEPRLNDLVTWSMCRNERPGAITLGVTCEAEGTGAIMAASFSRGRAARGEVTGESDEAIEDEADHADVDERHDDVGEARGVPRVPDEEADADAAGQHLGGDDREPGEADADTQPREDVRGGGRHHDVPEELRLVEPQHAARRCGSPAGCCGCRRRC